MQNMLLKDVARGAAYHILNLNSRSSQRKLCLNHSDASRNISLVTRKPVFWVFDQVRLKPACSGAETC